MLQCTPRSKQEVPPSFQFNVHHASRFVQFFQLEFFGSRGPLNLPGRLIVSKTPYVATNLVLHRYTARHIHDKQQTTGWAHKHTWPQDTTAHIATIKAPRPHPIGFNRIGFPQHAQQRHHQKRKEKRAPPAIVTRTHLRA